MGNDHGRKLQDCFWTDILGEVLPRFKSIAVRTGSETQDGIGHTNCYLIQLVLFKWFQCKSLEIRRNIHIKPTEISKISPASRVGLTQFASSGALGYKYDNLPFCTISSLKIVLLPHSLIFGPSLFAAWYGRKQERLFWRWPVCHAPTLYGGRGPVFASPGKLWWTKYRVPIFPCLMACF